MVRFHEDGGKFREISPVRATSRDHFTFGGRDHVDLVDADENSIFAAQSALSDYPPFRRLLHSL